jgi:hypothetical protein
MGKARYALGGNAITSAQYDMSMTATTFFDVATFLREEEEREENVEETTTALRRRKPWSAHDTEGTHTAPTTEEAPVQKDPLYWFGLFVPPPLRQCQRDFISGVLALCV